MPFVRFVPQLLRPTAPIYQYNLVFSRNFSLNLVNKMRFAQFQRKGDENTRLGVLSDDGSSIVDLSGQPSVPNDMIQFIKSNVSLADLQDKVRTLPSESINDNGIQLLSPVTNPEKIVCIGLNYLGHCQEQNKEAPKEPMFFSKFASTLTGPTGNVILHSITDVSFVYIRSYGCRVIVNWTIWFAASRLGSWIGRHRGRRGKTCEEGKCIGLCVRIQCCSGYLSTRLAKTTQWWSIPNWQINGLVLSIGTSHCAQEYRLWSTQFESQLQHQWRSETEWQYEWIDFPHRRYYSSVVTVSGTRYRTKLAFHSRSFRFTEVSPWNRAMSF